jgi:N-acetylglucosamine kinase-like BadF-type ATPase
MNFVSNYFLGVDGGQSGTTLLIGDETGRVLGCGKSGPCNHAGTEQGREKFTRAVMESLHQACAQAGLDPSRTHFRAACFGLSGGPRGKRPILEKLLSVGKLILVEDFVTALAGATAGQPGIITIAGTGSVAFGRNCRGTTAHAGGWGYLFGDEGGAFDLVRQALRGALRFEEGWGPPTTLLPRMLEASSAASANELMHRFYTAEFPRHKIAAFAPLVDEEAQQGDIVARVILENAARQLAELTAAVHGQLFQEGEAVCVAYLGGVFRSRLLLEHFRMLIEMHKGCRCGPPTYGPATGALIEAYRAEGLAPEIQGQPQHEK